MTKCGLSIFKLAVKTVSAIKTNTDLVLAPYKGGTSK